MIWAFGWLVWGVNGLGEGFFGMVSGFIVVGVVIISVLVGGGWLIACMFWGLDLLLLVRGCLT